MKELLQSHFEAPRPHQRRRTLAHTALAAGLLLCFAATLPADSLWCDGMSKPMSADKRAAHVGDIVTILVQENSTATVDNTTKTSKQSSIDAAITSFLYSPAASGLLTKGGTMPALKVNNNSSFNGGGTINNSQQIAASVAVRVTDVLPNGNLIVEGTRESAFSGEHQTIVLRGTIRQDDIMSNNTVYSYNVADATIKFISKGTITDSQRKGWFHRLWDKLSPILTEAADLTTLRMQTRPNTNAGTQPELTTGPSCTNSRQVQAPNVPKPPISAPPEALNFAFRASGRASDSGFRLPHLSRGSVAFPKRPLFLCVALLASTLLASAGAVKVRDLVMISGARDNQLVGYGLVAGLAGDGDKDPVYTKQTIANILQRYGVNVPAATLSSKNIGVVLVTADIPAFIKPGARLDVQVSSMGDAKSLQGGVLLQTPLLGADNRVYAVAQGPLSVGGFSAGSSGGGGANVTKNHPTVGTIINGALVEREIPATIVHGNSIELLLREPSFTSAVRMAEAINLLFTNSALAIDSTSVRVRLPDGLEARPVDFIARLEAVEVTPDTPARIIINERTGTIVATSTIRISNCAVSQGNLTITVASTLDVSQPNPFSNTGTTVTTPRTDTKVTESKGALVNLPELPTVEKVASVLNALGVTPRDMMAIFQTMKQAGALQAELIVR